MYKNLEYGMTYRLNSEQADKLPRCFKKYVRNGKTFWRNYKRSIDGGLSLLEFMAIKKDEATAKMIENLAINIYS